MENNLEESLLYFLVCTFIFLIKKKIKKMDKLKTNTNVHTVSHEGAFWANRIAKDIQF